MITLIEFPWMYNVTKYASQQPFIFMQTAFNRFFKGLGAYPQFKKKNHHDSFYVGNDHIKLDGRRIKLPKLGWVKMREALRFSGKVISATISRVANKWFVSLNIQLEHSPKTCESQASVGVDLGIKALATLSNGEAFEAPKPLKKFIKKLKRLQRSLADLGFYEFRRQLEYKSQYKGNYLFIADRWFPSSKLCSNCGNKKEQLSERVYHCEACGQSLDRDFNAAINLKKLLD